MKRSKLPDYKEKQKILYIDKTPAKTLISLGERYLEEQRVSDALEFFQRAGFREGLENILQLSAESGDVMDYQQALKALKMEASKEDWERIGQRALALGKIVFALQAFEMSQNPDLVEQTKKRLASEGTFQRS